MITNLEPSKKAKRGIFFLPNLFTTTALFFGFYAITATIDDRFETAAIAIFLAMIFDSIDGRIARLTNTETVFGAEYDSLSDLVCFGMAPALLAYQWSLSALDNYFVSGLVAFIYLTATAVRLARFNSQVGKADKAYFQGLASPAAAAILAGFVWLCNDYQLNGSYVIIFAWLLIIFTSVLMVSRCRYYSFKNLELRQRKLLMALLIMIFLLLISLNPPSILFFFFLCYAISGPIFSLMQLRKSRIPRA